MTHLHPQRPSRGWYGSHRSRPDRLHQLNPPDGLSAHDRVVGVRSYHLTAGPAKRFKCLSSGSSFSAQAATPRFPHPCGVSAIPMPAPVHKPVQWDTGQLQRQHKCAQRLLSHGRVARRPVLRAQAGWLPLPTPAPRLYGPGHNCRSHRGARARRKRWPGEPACLLLSLPQQAAPVAGRQRWGIGGSKV
jgi:hypothetical protein